MSFTDKMRESLGAEGARIEVTPPSDPTPAGAEASIGVTIVGGTRDATVDALIVRLVQADRHWVDESGNRIAEADAPPREERKGLTAGWDRATIAELRVDVGATVAPKGSHTVDVSLTIPDTATPTTAACSHTVNVQADIKGQIDPTGNARINVATPS